jgi:hypothetical protein
MLYTYVKAIIERIIKDTKALKALGLNAVAIMSNNKLDINLLAKE